MIAKKKVQDLKYLFHSFVNPTVSSLKKFIFLFSGLTPQSIARPTGTCLDLDGYCQYGNNLDIDAYKTYLRRCAGFNEII